MSQTIPFTLVREQLPAITGMTNGLLLSMTPHKIKSLVLDDKKIHTSKVKSGSNKLVDHYVQWSGVNDDRYAHALPAHFFSKYGMGMVARLTGQVPYNMLSVLNQGCRIQAHSLIPRNTPILLSGELVDCSEDGNRVRIHTRVTAGTRENPEAMTVDTMAAVMLGKSSKKKDSPPRKEPEYETIGEWSADRNEGLRFFYLTGDFNPIHTFWPFAKRTRFGGCILHGFGSLARTYETIQNSGIQIADFDVRFIKPNLLPCQNLQVQVGKESLDNGHQPLRLINANGDVFLAGNFLARG